MRPMNTKTRFLSAGCFFAFAVTLWGQPQVLVTMNPAKDNTLYTDPAGALSNAIGESLFVGMTASGLERRALIQFDIAAALPAGANIISADLQMEMKQTIAGVEPIALRAVTQDWGEGTSHAFPPGGGGTAATTGDATWLHTYFPGSFWNTPGGDFQPYVAAVEFVGGVGTYMWGPTMQMVADVQSWLDQPASNHGWILLSTESVVPSAKRFASREDPTPASRPLLTVVYSMGNVAQAIPVGSGCVPAGSGLTDLAFRAFTNEAPVVGSSTFRLQASDGLPGGLISIYLALGMAPSPLILPGPLGCPIYLDVLTAQQLLAQGLSPIGPIPSANGDLDLPIPLPNVPGLSGASLSVQVLSFTVADARTSNGLILNFQ